MRKITDKDTWSKTLDVKFSDLIPEAQQTVLQFFDCKTEKELIKEEWEEKDGTIALIVKTGDSRHKISKKKKRK